MKLTKDESRILADTLRDYKFIVTDKTGIKNLFQSLEILENRLEENGKDKRRNGRTSENEFYDLLKRFATLTN